MPRRLPVGAELGEDGASFRVWAPACRALEAVFADGRAVPLAPEAGGYFSGFAERRRAGDLYRFRLDGGDLLPDPASRFQPEGPHGPSQLVDPSAFRWTDSAWRGLGPKGQVFYELHVGTFSREGDWAGAARRLPELAELGVTAVEVMPVAEFPGRFNWGYDGVLLFAPTRNYGRPDDFRAFVDRAHALGLGVLLDVVYNHFGPDGNYLGRYSPHYVSRRHATDWGEAVNYDGEESGPVRELAFANAAYWVSEYHLDGLRLDATQTIYDDSPEPVFTGIARSARVAAGGRGVLVVAENETQEARFVASPERGGYGFDGLWNDDYHHSLRVALTGRREAYYVDYAGTPQELVSCVKRGYLYQGQWYAWQRKRRGSPAHDAPPEAFVCYLENHDQVANCSPDGRRLGKETDPARLRAATALLLLGPGTPLLFQGQEDGGSAPFMFFADHVSGLREKVAEGRRAFMAQFPSMSSARAQQAIPDPADPALPRLCLAERPPGEEALRWRALHRDLLALRRADAVVCEQGAGGVDGAVLGPEAFCLRLFGAGGDDRLLLVNLGPDLALSILPEPLLADPPGRPWRIVWSSEDQRYGGCGEAALRDGRWLLPGGWTGLLAPREETDGAA